MLSIILDNLGDLTDKYNNLNHKVSTLNIPDTAKIMALIAELEKKQFECERARRVVIDDLEQFKTQTNISLEELNTSVSTLQETDVDFE